jgi:hypothetical protein
MLMHQGSGGGEDAAADGLSYCLVVVDVFAGGGIAAVN